MVQPSVGLHTPGILNKSLVPISGLQQLALAYILSEYQTYVPVYTDGSASPKASTAAVAILAQQMTRGFILDHNSTSTAAELVAIREAIRRICGERPQEWCILTDSNPAQQIFGFRPHTAYQALQFTELLSCAQKKIKIHYRIVFQWIPGHCGLNGNEMADAEAKRALSDDPRTVVPFSRPDITCLLSELMKGATRRYWGPARRSSRPP
ncbi:hypothetical protein HPB49_012042 [Dermacentor silvarum]|uniref:Uncharacterized protein n=1 Tax=Dermacentor silvarum TaxID=543639 RepID=A0ACB8C3J1_DERSI|nr:hypothetical protein HPB49_012042 [Dermacentor silvarum]